MKKAEEMKWIVHPHSYEKEHTEISVVHESEFHAMGSRGWFSARKIFIYTDSMYGCAPEEVKAMLVKYAEDLCEKMNAEHPVSIAECQDAINYRIAMIGEQKAFAEALSRQVAARFKSEARYINAWLSGDRSIGVQDE